MKVIRAYGGKIIISRQSRGWSWEYYRKVRRVDPVSITVNGKTFTFSTTGGHGFGDALTLQGAMSTAINLLKAKA